MSITANKGEFVVAEQADPRTVESSPRGYAAMFSPSSSRSRFDVTDSGLRYELWLDDGFVMIRPDGEDWRFLNPVGTDEPWAFSFQRLREGEPLLKAVKFDMLAASRGRLIAKEAGTDRMFHLVVDPLFRTHTLGRAPADSWLRDGGDPIVPSNYFKLDPGFFDPDARPFVPPEMRFDYGGHPAAERFRVFALSMDEELSDGMSVVLRPNTWHLIDGRSRLKVIDFDDLRCIGDRELKQVATKRRIKAVLRDGFRNSQEDISQLIRDVVEGLVDLTPEVPLPQPVRSAVNAARDAAEAADDAFGDLLDAIESVPFIGGLVRAVRRAIDDTIDEIDDLRSAIANEIESAVRDALADFVESIELYLVDGLLDLAASAARDWIEEDGFGALFYPAMIAVALQEHELRTQGAIVVVPPTNDSAPPATSLSDLLDSAGSTDPVELGRTLAELMFEASRSSECGQRSKIRVNLREAIRVLLKRNDNRALRDMIAELVKVAGHHPVPNAPPEDVPSYVHVVYESATADIALPAGIPRPEPERHERRSIDFKKVMDLGVGTIHWSEQWQRNFGGEIHSLLATRPIAQQERLSLTQFRLLNGPVIDGDGWQDGTTNFYMLVELEDGPGRSHAAGAKGIGAKRVRNSASRFAILWHDEQTYFTQRWRLLHPTRDTAGDLFSLARTLRDRPADYAFDVERFWCPFEADCITHDCRMAMSRQMIAVSGVDKDSGLPEIYTICFAYGICDHTWRWRPMPAADTYAPLEQALAATGDRLPPPAVEVVYTNTLAMRDDGTLSLRGFKRDSGGQLREGRWVQKYLPADCRHVPDRTQLVVGAKPATGFSHPWDFVLEETYRQVDRYYAFNVYSDVDSRSQYYKVDLIPDEKGVLPTAPEVRDRVWANGGAVEQPLTIDTVNVNWELPEEDGFLKLDELLTNRRDLPTMSMYENTTRLRLVEREPLGLVAVFDDKRDDDLQAASLLPRETVLVEDTSAPAVRRSGGPRRSARRAGRRIRVRFRENRRVELPPVVQHVEASRVVSGGRTTALQVTFWTPQGIEDAYENLWRAHVGALDENGNAVNIFDADVFATFTRAGKPSAPLALDYPASDVITAEYRYDGEIAIPNASVRALVDRYCTPDGRRDRGASIWFENILGSHCAPESIEFLP